MKESSKQAWEQSFSFKFAADKLIFHPQTAEDCGWKASIVGFYEVTIASYVATCTHVAKYIGKQYS